MSVNIGNASRAERSFGLGRSGAAALEFGLAMPFLLILVVGMAEVGMAGYEAMQVRDAAESGVVYASQHAADFTGMTNAVINATGTTGITATPAPAAFCGCPGAAGVTVGDCTTLCADGSSQGRYVRVSASLTHVPILSFPGFPNPLVLTGRAVVRVQ